MEPTVVAVRAVRKSELRLGKTVAGIGGGTIGLFTLQVARGTSAVYLVEPRQNRCELASTLMVSPNP